MVTTETVDPAIIRSQLCDGFDIVPRGAGYLIHTPFVYDDGDVVTVYLSPSVGGRWVVSDGGDAMMRLSYRMDARTLQTEMRRRLIESAHAVGEVTERNGVLSREAPFEDISAAVFGLSQAALRILSVSLLSQDRVRSAFQEDVRQLISNSVQSMQAVREDWHDPELDPKGLYQVDWRIETLAEPLFVFALTTTSRVKDATITLHQYDRWGVSHRAVGIAESLTGISKRSWEQFYSIADRAFPQLSAGRQRIEDYLRRTVGRESDS